MPYRAVGRLRVKDLGQGLVHGCLVIPHAAAFSTTTSDLEIPEQTLNPRPMLEDAGLRNDL